MSASIGLSIVIPSQNRREYLRRYLSNTLNQNKINYEVIVVDYDSNDDTRLFLASIESPRLRVIRASGTQGFHLAKARNLGVVHARAPHILSLDVDIELKHDEVLAYLMDEYRKLLEIPARFHILSILGGSCCIYPKSLWQHIGGYPEAFCFSFEDTAFRWLCEWAGAIAQKPSAFVEADSPIRLSNPHLFTAKRGDYRAKRISDPIWDKNQMVLENGLDRLTDRAQAKLLFEKLKQSPMRFLNVDLNHPEHFECPRSTFTSL